MAALRRASAQVALRLPATAGVARSRASVLGTRAVDVSMGAKRAYTDGEAKYSGGNLPMNLGVRVVPEQSAWVVERFGRFSQVLAPGLHFLIPLVDKIAYVHSLKETVIKIPNQTAITKDDVAIGIDGVLYVKVIDPKAASYGVSDAIYAVTQLAQTTMRSELGKMTLDRTFAERESLNSAIVAAINEASASWGIHCLRYEIRDIAPPVSVKAAMDLQAEAERRKRAEILESEGNREAAINTAKGAKESILLKAQGEAAGIIARARATAAGIRTVSKAIKSKGGASAVSLRVAEQYVEAFGKIAKKGNTVLLPANTGDPAAMVAQAMSVYRAVQGSSGALGSAVDDDNHDNDGSDDDDGDDITDLYDDPDDPSARFENQSFTPVSIDTVVNSPSGSGDRAASDPPFTPSRF